MKGPQKRESIVQLVLPALAVQEAEIAALRQDAERYRWLRDNSRKWSWMPSQFNPEIISGFCCDGANYQGYAFDAAIAQVVQPCAPRLKCT